MHRRVHPWLWETEKKRRKETAAAKKIADIQKWS